MAKLKTRTRTIHNAGLRRVIGLLMSLKNQAPIPWDSQIERDFYYYLEYQLRVVRYLAQPETITFWFDGVSATYTPDVCVVYDTGEICYVEVKPDDKATDAEALARFEAIRRHYTKHGADFELVRASMLRRGYQMDNIRLLYRYAQWPHAPRDTQAILDHLPPAGLATDLATHTGWAREQGLDHTLIYHLLFTQRIGADLVAHRINPMMPLWRTTE